ncbi:hypothetical protein BGZ72_004613, partial [Mortierella alpina]
MDSGHSSYGARNLVSSNAAMDDINTFPSSMSAAAVAPVGALALQQQQFVHPSQHAINNANRKPAMTREQLKYCGAIIKELKKNRDAPAFLVPVDPVLLNIPDYPQVVKNPMDLSTVERKLNNVEYETVDDFVNDISLIFSNCYLYNGRELPVSICAANLETAFNRLLRRMPKEQIAKPAPDAAVVKESPKKSTGSKSTGSKTTGAKTTGSKSTGSKPKKEEKKEVKLLPVQLVTPAETASALPIHIQHDDETSEERRPKRDVHAPSKEIPTGVASKRKPSLRWKNDAQLRYCHSILRDFAKKSNAEFMFPFMEPVDWVKFNIPDYPKIIKKPMDVSTIRKKLEADEYDDAGEFEADVRLVLSNCFKFNPAGTPVHEMGRRMEKLFNSKWANRPAPPTPPPVEEVTVDSEDDSEDVDSSDDKIAEMERHLKSLSEKLETMKEAKLKGKGEKKAEPKGVQEKPAKTSTAFKTPKSPVRAPEKKTKRSRAVLTSSDEEEDEVPTITFKQKKELSEKINNLDAQRLGTVVQIIHSTMPHLRDSGEQGEIELDMDSLDPKTIYKLYQYVKGNSTERKTKKSKTSYSAEGASKKNKKQDRPPQKVDRYHEVKAIEESDDYASLDSVSSGSSSESSDESSASRRRKNVGSLPKTSRSPSVVRERARSTSVSSSIPSIKPRKRSITEAIPPTADVEPVPQPKARKQEKSWHEQPQPPASRATMSFEVAPLDLAEIEASAAKATNTSQTNQQKKSDETTQLENLEHWAAFTAGVQPVKASNPQTSSDATSKKVDPVWEQFQKDMKARQEKEKQLRDEQLRKEQEVKEENERRRQEIARREELEKERKKEIAREAYLREQKRADEIREKRDKARERNRAIAEATCPWYEQMISMRNFEVDLRSFYRDEMRRHEEKMRRCRELYDSFPLPMPLSMATEYDGLKPHRTYPDRSPPYMPDPLYSPPHAIHAPHY